MTTKRSIILSCDRLVDAAIEVDREIDEPIRRVTDFEILRHHLEFLGRCPRCRLAAMDPPELPADSPPASFPSP
jgi:Fe2+ or Zn2+ uptake regulation protein